MAGHRPFKDLTKAWPADRRRRVKQLTEAMLKELDDPPARADKDDAATKDKDKQRDS